MSAPPGSARSRRKRNPKKRKFRRAENIAEQVAFSDLVDEANVDTDINNVEAPLGMKKKRVRVETAQHESSVDTHNVYDVLNMVDEDNAPIDIDTTDIIISTTNLDMNGVSSACNTNTSFRSNSATTTTSDMISNEIVKHGRTALASSNTFRSVYGDEPQLTIELKDGLNSIGGNINFGIKGNAISLSCPDVRSLMLHSLGDGMAAQWCILRNKPLVRRVISIAVPGLDAHTHDTYKDSMPFLSQLTKCPTSTPGSNTSLFSAQNVLLKRPIKQKKDKEKDGLKLNKKARNKLLEEELRQKDEFPPTHYILTKEQQKLHGYPTIDLLHNNNNNMGENASDVYVCAPPFNPDVHAAIPEEESYDQRMARIMSLDCEMCLTTNGSELTRVALVDVNGNVLVSEFVKPRGRVTDYVTQYSGVTKEDLDQATLDLNEVRNLLFTHIHEHTILVGHSLENDLHALCLVHAYVIDSAVVYPRTAGTLLETNPTNKHGLKWLTRQHLNRKIQQTSSGHTPDEDAIAALDLIKLKISKGPLFGTAEQKKSGGGGEAIFQAFQRAGHRCAMIDRVSLVKAYAADASSAHVDAISAIDDTRVYERALALCRRRDSEHCVEHQYLWLQFKQLATLWSEHTPSVEQLRDIAQNTLQTSISSQLAGVDALPEFRNAPRAQIIAALSNLDARIRQIYEALPKECLVLVHTLHGQYNLTQKWTELNKSLQEQQVWDATWQNRMEAAFKRVSSALTYMAVTQ